MLTGATGSVGTEVALNLLNADVDKLVLFLRDDEKIDQRLLQLLNDPMSRNRVFVVELDLREPQKIVQKFGHSLKNHLNG